MDGYIGVIEFYGAPGELLDRAWIARVNGGEFVSRDYPGGPVRMPSTPAGLDDEWALICGNDDDYDGSSHEQAR